MFFAFHIFVVIISYNIIFNRELHIKKQQDFINSSILKPKHLKPKQWL